MNMVFKILSVIFAMLGVIAGIYYLVQIIFI
jgi:hypothetical protein